MKHYLLLTGAVVLALGLAGCAETNGMADSGDTDSDNGTDPTPEPDTQVEFAAFVKAQIDMTADDREAVAINDLEFSFEDRDNEAVFDDLF